jgi:cytochrome b561
MNVKPLLPPDTRPWEYSIERAVHFLIYATVIAMPLAGWIGSTAAGHAPQLGPWALALPIAKNKVIAETAFNIHGLLALTIIALLCLHISAAFFHYFIKKDTILQRML